MHTQICKVLFAKTGTSHLKKKTTATENDRTEYMLQKFLPHFQKTRKPLKISKLHLIQHAIIES